jgi:predicted DNA-binding transcriptional regulator AlpA
MSEPKSSLFGEAFRSELKECLREVIKEESNTTKDDALMDVPQVAEYLKQSPDWVYRHWKQLGGRKIGAKSIRFYRSDIDRWLKSRRA